jgi:hypothetical protein
LVPTFVVDLQSVFDPSIAQSVRQERCDLANLCFRSDVRMKQILSMFDPLYSEFVPRSDQEVKATLVVYRFPDFGSEASLSKNLPKTA